MAKNIFMKKTIKLIFLTFFPVFLFAQSNRINFSGTVVDSSSQGITMSEVSVFTKSPHRAIGKTNYNGEFVVNVSRGTVLVLEYVGYTSVEIVANEANNNKVHAMYIDQESNNLREVAVVGFRSVRKEASTASSITITSKDLEGMPAADVTSLLQGRMPGLNIQNTSGAPGARSSIFQRGLSNVAVQGEGANAYLTPTSPLFVVDGVPVDLNTNFEYGFNQGGPGVSPISMIPPEDIEEITLLRDAAATALWGSRGAYGVILITTKRGKSQVPRVQYQGNFFYNNVPRLREVIGGKEERYIRMNQIVNFDTSYTRAMELLNGTSYLSDSLNPYWNNSTDWQAVFYKPTYNQSHNINILGGTDKFNYKTNVGYYNEKGIIRNTGFTRYVINMNAQFQPNERFRLRASVNSGLSSNQKGSGVGLLQNGVAQGSRASSLLPPPSAFSENNAAVEGLIVEDDNKTVRITPSVNLMWMPVKDLQLQTETNYTYNSGTSDNFRPSIVNSGRSRYTSYFSREDILYNRNSINYNKSFLRDDKGQGVHNFNAFIFSEAQMEQMKANQSLINTTPNDFIWGPTGYDWYGSYAGTFDNLRERRNLAYGGSISYNYKLRYVFDFQYREDGSSTNGPNVGFKKSPTVSLRWNMNRERFFEEIDWVNVSSVRTSFGRSLIPSGSIFDVYGVYTPSTNFNGLPTVGSGFGSIPNPLFQPFTNTSFNFGYEGTFFNNRINFTYDYYYSQKENQIWEIQLPNNSGFNTKKVNDLSLVNYGHEFLVSYRSLPTSGKNPFSYQISANAAFNRNILAEFPSNIRQYITVISADALQLPVLYRLGADPLRTLLYNTYGVYATDRDVATDPLTGLPITIGRGTKIFLGAGDPKWTDLNGDYIIDANDLIGLFNPQPKVTGGIQLFMRYGKWTLNSNVSFTLFRDVINTALAERFRNFANPSPEDYSVFLRSGALVPIDQYNFWRAEGDNALYPNPYNFVYAGSINPFRYNQTLFVEDGSYWKWNQITISYEPDISWLQSKLGIRSARLSLTGGNLLILSRYSGSSPENVTDLGRDNPNGYPNARTISFGLYAEF